MLTIIGGDTSLADGSFGEMLIGIFLILCMFAVVPLLLAFVLFFAYKYTCPYYLDTLSHTSTYMYDACRKIR